MNFEFTGFEAAFKIRTKAFFVNVFEIPYFMVYSNLSEC